MKTEFVHREEYSMKKRCLTILFVMLVLISTLTIPAFAGEHLLGTCGEYLTWTYDVDEGVLTIAGTGEMYDYSETAPPWSEYSGEITELVMEHTVASISENAFMGCENLYTIRYDGTLAQWVETKIGLGNWELGKAAPICTDWEPDEYAHYGYFGDMGDRVLWLLDGKGTLYVYGTGYADDLCENPPAWEDWKNEIGWVYVKDGIMGLDDLAFSECYNLETVDLADSVEYLGISCFSDCPNLREVKLASKTDWRDIPEFLFSGCTSLVKVNIPEGTPTIGTNAFYQCSALEEITIPESVKVIYANAFMGCTSLKEVNLPGAVNRLWTSSRWDDYGKSPFAGCSALEEFTVSENNRDFSADEQGALYNKDKTHLIQVPATKSGSFIVPDTVTYIWAGAFQDCVGLTEIILPEGLERMHNKVFQNCTGLKKITIPDSVTEIGYDIFWKCSNLESVKMSKQVTILDGTFNECASLKEFDISDAVTELGYRTFYGCKALERVSVPKSITAIGKESFTQCSALTEVLYDGYAGEWDLIDIKEGNECLNDEIVKCKVCKDHEVITVPAVEPTCIEEGYTESSSCAVCSEVFTTRETIPAKGHDVTDGVCTVCGEAVDWYFTPDTGTLTICFAGPMDDYDGELDGPWWDLREQVQHVVVQEGVTTIGNSAFPQFNQLKTVTLPQGITSIGRLAFQLCEALESINIPDTVTSIGEAAFNGTSKLAKICIPKSVEAIGPAAFEGSLYRTAYEVDPENPYFSSDLVGNLYNKEKTKLIMAPNYMKAVVIPASVTEIGDGVFALSTHMNAIYFCGTEEQWNAMKIGLRNEHMPATVYVGVSKERDCAAGNHIAVTKEGKAPTCTEEGSSGYMICVICSEITKAPTVLEKLPHDYVNGICTMCGGTEPEKPVESPFTDVQTTDWFFAPVLWAKETGVTGGKTATTFAPDESCTRAQVVTFLWAANGKPAPKSASNPFTDVPNDAWYLQPVLWAVENGVTGGTSPTTFGPDNYCTRAQVVTFLYAAAGKPEMSASSTFDDVADTDWFAKPVIWAKENNVTGGISPTQFGPNNVCTRAQVVTFLYSSKDNMPDVPDTPDVPDVPEKPVGDHEAYGAKRHELWQSAANTPLDQLPVYNDTATYEGIRQILDTCDPDGGLMFRYDPEGAFGWVFPANGMTGDTDTAIHETYHGFSYDFGWGTTTYYLENGYFLVVPETKTYLSEKMTVMIPEENRTFRFEDYVGTGSYLSSNKSGIYGLMDEFNAYQMGMNYGVNMFDYYCAQESSLESWCQYINGCENNRQAYAEFRYYILTYLLYAKVYEPEVYEGLMGNEKLRYAFTVVESNFAEDIARYEADLLRLDSGELPGTSKIKITEDTFWFGNQGTGRFTAEYKKLMGAMSAPAYVEMMETFTLK